ncbi:MAG: hypothetical protein KKA79_02510 [Nanoarchaeota archaeon]|nr:hypothetical protein [Nanoarchaeota archaeon]
MKLPESFRPSKNLDEKIEKMVTGNLLSIDNELLDIYGDDYQKLYDKLNALVWFKERGKMHDMVLTICDYSDESRYEDFKMMAGQLTEDSKLGLRTVNFFKFIRWFDINNLFDYVLAEQDHVYVTYISGRIREIQEEGEYIKGAYGSLLEHSLQMNVRK